MMQRSIRSLVLAAAVVPLAASFASAQYRVDNGTARDANNRIGSGGYNDARADSVINNRVGGLAGNYLVTGNVTGGRQFRGNLGYTAAQDFRGNLGSADFDPFIRDSAGVGDIRGNNFVGNQQLNPQPFFGGRTVAPPPGFVRSQANNGTYVIQGAAPILPNDGRADFGGASRADVSQSLIGNHQQFGNAGFAPSSALAADGPNFDNSPLQLSEFTTLARQRRDLFGAADPGQRVNDPTNPANGGAKSPADNNPFNVTPVAQPNSDANAPGGTNSNGTAANGTTLDIRAGGSQPVSAQPDAADVRPIGDTGQSLSRRSTRAADNNPQYAQLQERLQQARGGRNPNQTVGSQPLTPQPVGAGSAISTGQGVQPGTVRRSTGADAGDANKGADRDADTKDGGMNGGLQPGEKPSSGEERPGAVTTPRSSPALPGGAGGIGGVGAAKPGTPSKAGPDLSAPTEPVPTDNLQLPRPEGAAPTTQPGAMPVKIVSLSTGVKNAQLAKTLTQAEEQMRAGKFGSAIDTYDRAEEMANDDPLVFMGRSMAELGGGYYRNAEIHLRQAFGADPSLLYAKFDLRALLGDDRLNFLAGNLNEIANKNAKDPGPLLLLAFIYYNGGMEDRAARALDMAQLRAGGKDHDVDALRKNWQLDAPAEMNK